MVVDDDLHCRQIVEVALKNCCEFVSMASGVEAVECFINTFRNKEKKFKVILLDFEMPEMNGIDVIVAIKKAEEARKIPRDQQVKIIMTTSHSDREIVVGCKTVGCHHYIIKPVTKDKLQEKFKLLKII